MRRLVAAGISLLFWEESAVAGDFLQAPYLLAQDLDVSEVRAGPAFSNLELHLGAYPEFQSFDQARLDSLQLEILFGSPNLDLFRWLGSPRPSIGAVVGFGGFESLVHVGLDWHLPIFKTPFYLEAGLGAGIHDGYLNGAPAGFRNLGCRFLAHYEYGVGMNVSPNVTLTAQWQHLSGHDFGCAPNDGLNEAGLVLGWKF
jgi:lipid A 3-O-deacylase